MRLNGLSKIPSESRAEVLRRAEMDLVTRLTAAVVAYPLLLLLLRLATPICADHPAAYWEATAAIALAVLVRVSLFVFRKQLYARGRMWIVVPLLLSMVLSAGTTGLLYLDVMKSYGLSNWTFTFMMMWLLGISAGSTISFTPSFSLLSLQLGLLFGPAIPYEFLTSAPHDLSLGLATLAFAQFLILQGHRLHGMYWDLLSDRALEVRRTQELEAAKTAAERAQEQLRYQANHDILTGVMNRAGILGVCGRELERAVRLQTSLGLLMIDLDHFKQVNDRFGHLGGDEALRCIAERIASNLRSYDALGRYGGEEFLIVLPSCELEQAAIAAERIRESIEANPVPLGRAAAKITASFGVTVLDAENDTEQRQLIARADAALYEAKRSGRNCVAMQPPRSATVCLFPARGQVA